MQGVDPAVIADIARGKIAETDLPGPEQALLRFAETMTRHAHRIGPGDIETLREVGWSEDQISEAVYVIALFAFFNRVADAFGLDTEGYPDGSRGPVGNPIR